MRPKLSLGLYKIVYDNGVVQEKDLVLHDSHRDIVVPSKMIIDTIKSKKVKTKEDEIEIRRLSKNIMDSVGDNYFTSESPLYKEIESGILELPLTQGGKTNCKIILVD